MTKCIYCNERILNVDFHEGQAFYVDNGAAHANCHHYAQEAIFDEAQEKHANSKI